MKKLLIVTRWYVPAVKSGGTVTSLKALVKGLDGDFDITIITSNKDLGEDKPYENIIFDKLVNKFNVPTIYLSKISLSNMYRKIKYINPDVIYLNSFHDITTQIVLFLKLFRLINTRLVLAPRGELAEGALAIKSKKKNVYLSIHKLLGLSSNVIYHVTRPDECKEVKKIFSDSQKIENIPNLSLDLTSDCKLPFKNKKCLRIIFISRVSSIKNLLYSLDILQKYSYEGSIVFDIYGPIEDTKYWEECSIIINKFPENIKSSYQGSVEPEEIKEVLLNYHLFFLPTKGENFGHSIVEAMQVGLIPLISDKTPWQNLEKKEAGFSISLDAKKDFSMAIKKVLLLNDEDFIKKSENTKKYIENKIDNRGNLNKYVSLFNM